jgi:GH24 family phage-related lysozyme (muramidase)
MPTGRGIDDAQLADDVETFAAGLTAHLSAGRSYPEPAQQRLFDMAYNLGVGGLLQFKNLLAACASRDWEMTATECQRAGSGDTRNSETAALLRQSASR